MNDSDVQRHLGAMEARTTILERRMETVERSIQKSLSGIDAKIDALQSAVDSSSGGRRAIAWAVGVLGAATALLTTLYHMGVIR